MINCVFVDESGFNINTKTYNGINISEHDFNSENFQTRATSYTIVRLMSPLSAINLQRNTSKNAVAQIQIRKKGQVKLRKKPEKEKEKCGMVTEHYINFVAEIIRMLKLVVRSKKSLCSITYSCSIR